MCVSFGMYVQNIYRIYVYIAANPDIPSQKTQRGKYKYTMTGIVHRGQNTMEKMSFKVNQVA